MNLSLWIAAGLLATVALIGGVTKTFVPKQKLPAALDIALVLVPATAVCWVLLMVGAMITHIRHNEFAMVGLNVAYLALAAFVAWGRFGFWSFTGPA